MIADIQLGLNLHFEMKRNAWKKIFFWGFRQLKVSAIALMAEVTLPEVRWETTLYEPVFRKLVKKSLGIFLSLQKLAEAGVVSDQLVRRTILKNMKSQMHSCDNWSTGESVSTVQERDKRLTRAAGKSR